MLRARDSLAQATKLLLPASTTTTDTSRHHGVAAVNRTPSHDVPKSRNRSQTVQRPKTTFFSEDDNTITSGSTATIAGDHVITAPIPPGKVSKMKAEKKRVKLDRSSTFRSKDKERDKSAGGDGEGSFRVSEQQYIKCIINLKDSLQEVMVSMYVCEDQIIIYMHKYMSLAMHVWFDYCKIISFVFTHTHTYTHTYNSR